MKLGWAWPWPVGQDLAMLGYTIILHSLQSQVGKHISVTGLVCRVLLPVVTCCCYWLPWFACCLLSSQLSVLWSVHSCGWCTNEMISFWLAFALACCPSKEFSSIPCPFFGTVCLICPSGFFACQMLLLGWIVPFPLLLWLVLVLILLNLSLLSLF